jgi:hypothetical protein
MTWRTRTHPSKEGIDQLPIIGYDFQTAKLTQITKFSLRSLRALRLRKELGCESIEWKFITSPSL